MKGMKSYMVPGGGVGPRQFALARYFAELEAANAEHAALVEPIGGHFASSEADYVAVVKPARKVWDARVAAAFAAYEKEVA